jgi:uncharacterized damage-inducible protein DinB
MGFGSMMKEKQKEQQEKKRRNARLEAELDDLRSFFAYNTFVRKRYLTAIAKLPKRVLAKDTGASFPSIVDIFVHVLDVYRCWFLAYETGEACERWQHRHETGEDNLPELIGLSVAQAKEMERRVDELIGGVMRKLRASDLSKSFDFTIGSGKDRKETITTTTTRRVDDMLWHLIEEELQHRGELNALLWQEDVEPPVTSWFGWKRSLSRPGR